MQALLQMRELRESFTQAGVRVVLAETVAAGVIDGEAWGPFTPALAAELDRTALGRFDPRVVPAHAVVRFRVRLEQCPGTGALIDGGGCSLFEALGNALELATKVGWIV